ncbi:thiamine phosphate synthase [Pseudogemmobacter humi]|uniref:Thiamine-phosphate pyrophosphorylase n=1 Tax=Pseudogemmobacter humi TaxID=2483812 RepID=A0A3P5XAI1_9RHOB|nr:thiamine phosphate synthase [Pseudogemmobacter humi]VDC31748.1 thiamine-phosphate pyrophosphorylase [Pseudogemmobacter humi]
MASDDRPQITLITPPSFQTDIFADQLARVLDAVDIACLRISLATKDTDNLGHAADLCREIAHARDVAVVIDTHLLLAERHGLDGVHLTDGARSVRKARKDLGPDAIVGAWCGASRHEGLNAGEAGADYVAFGPVGDTGLGDGSRAGHDLFAWWSEMIEVPVIAEGGLSLDLIERFAPVSDFFAIGEEIWRAEDPLAALKALIAPLG